MSDMVNKVTIGDTAESFGVNLTLPQMSFIMPEEVITELLSAIFENKKTRRIVVQHKMSFEDVSGEFYENLGELIKTAQGILEVVE